MNNRDTPLVVPNSQASKLIYIMFRIESGGRTHIADSHMIAQSHSNLNDWKDRQVSIAKETFNMIRL
jgi:hypothetical protein